MTTEILPALLRVEEAAKLLQISRTKAFELVHKGILPSVKIDNARRVPRKRLEEWIEANTTGGLSG